MLYLASASPRRKELLTLAGYSFTVLPANADETAPLGLSPRETAGLLARRKAEAVQALPEFSARQKPGDVILAADTVVDLGGKILGKPKDREDANGPCSPCPAGGTACTPASVCSRAQRRCAGWNPRRWNFTRSRRRKLKPISTRANRWTRPEPTGSRGAARFLCGGSPGIITRWSAFRSRVLTGFFALFPSEEPAASGRLEFTFFLLCISHQGVIIALYCVIMSS